MTILFGVAGLPFLLIGIFLLRLNRHAIGKWTPVAGRVVGYTRVHPHDKVRNYYAVVRFEHRARKYLSQLPIGSPTPLYPIGTPIKTFVSPDDPPRTAFELGTLKLFGLVFFGLGTIFVGIAVFTFELNLFYLAGAAIVLFPLVRGAFRNREEIEKAFRGMSTVNVQKDLFHEACLEEEGAARFDFEDPVVVQHQAVRHARTSRRMGYVLILAGLAGAGGSFHWSQKREAFLAAAKSTSGVIASFRASSDSDGTIYYPIVKFRHPASSEEVRFQHTVGTSHPGYRVGEQVTVLYDEKNPQTAMIDSGFWNHAVPWIFFGVALLLAWLGWKSATYKVTPPRA